MNVLRRAIAIAALSAFSTGLAARSRARTQMRRLFPTEPSA